MSPEFSAGQWPGAAERQTVLAGVASAGREGGNAGQSPVSETPVRASGHASTSEIDAAQGGLVHFSLPHTEVAFDRPLTHERGRLEFCA